MAARRGNRVFLWIIMGLLAIGLVGWGGGVATGRTNAIGSVGGLDIPAQAYATALRNQIRAIEEQAGQPIPFDQAQALGLDRVALSQLVTQRTLDAELARLGLSVGDARVAEAVVSLPAFQGLDGEFDRDLYREQLRRNGLDEETFETALREDTTRTLLQAAVVGGVPAPETLAETLAAYANERRGVTWALLPTEEVAATLPAPTEEELRAYYEANPEAFTAPEQRSIAFAWLTPEMIQDQVPVDEGAVRALYEERRGEFVQEERRLVERLVFGTEEEAAAAKARLDAGEVDFEALVEERGLQLSDADLGDVSRGELDDAGEAVFGAAPGDVLGPLPSSLGPALFRVNAVLAADETTFEEAAPDLRAELANDAAREVIDGQVAQVEDLVAGGATLEDLAERTDLELGAIEWSEGSTQGPAAYEPFRAAAAAIEEGDAPEIVSFEDGGIALLRLDGVTAPALRPFEEVRADVERLWRGQALRQAVLARAEAAAEAIAGGAGFEEQGLTPQAEEALTRRDVIEATPPDFTEAAFALGEGEARALPADGGAVVLRLDGIAPAPEDDPGVAAERQALASQLSGALAQDLYDAFARTLQVNSDIQINDAAVQAVNAQFN